MQLDVYLRETAHHATRLEALLAEAKKQLATNNRLSPLETGGVLHTIQVLIENSIGKAKHLVKAKRGVTPVDAYSAFADLAEIGLIEPANLIHWRQAIGMRNRIVHDYLNINEEVIFDLLRNEGYRFAIDFLKWHSSSLPS